MKKRPTQGQISNLLQTLVLGKKFLNKRQKEWNKKLLKHVDGIGVTQGGFDIILTINGIDVYYRVTVGKSQ